MKIPTDEVPQANGIKIVEKAARAVAEGAQTHQAIAEYLGYSERQGRYYRLGAEILGFLEKRGVNQSAITPWGISYLNATEPEKTRILAESISRSRLFQRVIALLELRRTEGATVEDLQGLIRDLTDTTPKMIRRRTSSVIAWLKSARMIESRNGRLFLRSLPEHIDVIEYASIDEPLLPSRFELREYSTIGQRASEAKEALVYEVARASHERANRVHAALSNLVAQRVRQANAIPRRNPLIDLAAQIGNDKYIFEIKSTTPTNLRSQVRAGVSQLYEYRYLQNLPEAKLVLVIEKPLPLSLSWMGDYLMRDRKIFLVWDGDLRTLHSIPTAPRSLRFLLSSTRE